jgi:hypothetical protein
VEEDFSQDDAHLVVCEASSSISTRKTEESICSESRHGENPVRTEIVNLLLPKTTPGPVRKRLQCTLDIPIKALVLA